MTEKELRKKVVDIARKDLGAGQYSKRHKDIIRDFNRIPGMGGMKEAWPWCAATVSVWGWRAGLTDIYYPSASCNAMIQKYIAHGRWIEDDAYIPKAGDLIMYDWQALTHGDCKGEADHVGLITDTGQGNIYVIEGNRNDAVDTRTIPYDWRYIRGFCVPDFASVADGKIEKDWTKALQEALNVSYDLHLDVDGSAGPLTRQAIDRHYLWKRPGKPIVNAHVSWLQGALKELGYSIHVDGSFWSETDRVLKEFQKDSGIDVDGYAGVQTHMTLLRKL